MYVRNWEIPAYDPVDVFEDIINQYLDLDITGFILDYPLFEKQLPIFEQIVEEVIPEFRKRY